MTVALTLRADLTAAEVVRALRGTRVNAILLRGPALARLLYAEGGVERPYGDVDLLVPPAGLHRAESVLSELGFEDRTVAGVIEGDRPTYAHTWVRKRDGSVVDLHFTLQGVRVAPELAWEIWSRETEALEMGTVVLPVLTVPGRAVVVALHAAAHGSAVGKPLEDVHRAVEQIPEDSWKAAVDLAEQLGAGEAFAIGLRLLPAGAALANRLALPHDASVETALLARSAPPMALGYEWLASTPGRMAKARLVGRKLFPPANFMRAWSPLARRGNLGLAGAYAIRVTWLAQHAIPGLIAWRRTRRELR
jgi:hypothetical protein